jgi:hypothetical protein
VDAAANEIIRYGDDGRALGTVNGLERQALGALRPSQIARTRDGMVLKLTEGRLVFLDRNRAVREQRDLFGESQGERGRIAAIRQWALAGDEVVLCGDVEKPGEVWGFGYVRAPLDDLEAFRFVDGAEFSGPDDPAELFCRLGYPQIATLGDTAYFLVMEETPRIFAVGAGDEAPRRLPATDLPPRPDLPGLVTPQDFPTVFAAVERSRMVAGLLASEDRLYALVREPRVGGTRWSLHEIDPATGEELGSAEVPSTANHLLVVPGERYWAFVEKGTVRDIGVQKVTGVLRVPAGHVENMSRGSELCAGRPGTKGLVIAHR